MILLRFKQVFILVILEAQLGHRRCTAGFVTVVALINVVAVTLDHQRFIGIFFLP